MRGLKSLNQLSVENQLWSRPVCLCGEWGWYICGVLSCSERILFEVYSSKYWERNQTTSSLMISKVAARAAFRPLNSMPQLVMVALLLPWLLCWHASGLLVNSLVFLHPVIFVKAWIWLAVQVSAAESQLVVISFECLFNNLKMLLSIHKLSLTSRDVQCH